MPFKIRFKVSLRCVVTPAIRPTTYLELQFLKFGQWGDQVKLTFEDFFCLKVLIRLIDRMETVLVNNNYVSKIAYVNFLEDILHQCVTLCHEISINMCLKKSMSFKGKTRWEN